MKAVFVRKNSSCLEMSTRMNVVGPKKATYKEYTIREGGRERERERERERNKQKSPTHPAIWNNPPKSFILVFRLHGCRPS